MSQAPSSQEFLSRFIEAFDECLGEAAEGDDVWPNWTAFMTGKQSRAAGSWKKRKVLEVTAKKLELSAGREDLALDLVLFHPGKSWGNLVAVEHENVIGTFEREIEKLMSVLAPLKVGITYDWKGDTRSPELVKLIGTDLKSRHPSIFEAPQTEYLFILGVKKHPKTLRWKFLAFSRREGPGTQFEDTGRDFHIAEMP